MKPDVTTTMLELIEQARERFPFDTPAAQICRGPCQACAVKLLACLDDELDAWEGRIAAGERPGLAELSRLLRTLRKVGRALAADGLMALPPDMQASDVAGGPTRGRRLAS
jgi:hypothetical protein